MSSPSSSSSCTVPVVDLAFCYLPKSSIPRPNEQKQGSVKPKSPIKARLSVEQVKAKCAAGAHVRAERVAKRSQQVKEEQDTTAGQEDQKAKCCHNEHHSCIHSSSNNTNGPSTKWAVARVSGDDKYSNGQVVGAVHRAQPVFIGYDCKFPHVVSRIDPYYRSKKEQIVIDTSDQLAAQSWRIIASGIVFVPDPQDKKKRISVARCHCAKQHGIFRVFWIYNQQDNRICSMGEKCLQDMGFKNEVGRFMHAVRVCTGCKLVLPATSLPDRLCEQCHYKFGTDYHRLRKMQTVVEAVKYVKGLSNNNADDVQTKHYVRSKDSGSNHYSACASCFRYSRSQDGCTYGCPPRGFVVRD